VSAPIKVLVTGASGMLGRGVAEALLARGDEVTVLQRRPSGLDTREVLGDIAEAGVVRHAAAGAAAVIHLAAKVDVVGRWAEYDHANVEGTRAVVEACQDAGVRRLVNVSSPSVAHTGRSLVGVGAERADPERARGNYARSKALAEQVALAADSENLTVVSVRPHLVWGPGDTQLVGRIIARARAGRLPIIATGAALIDTTYVDNAVDALLAALTADVHGEALVVSNGEPRPVGEVLRLLCEAAGVAAPSRHVPFGVALSAGAIVEGVWKVLDRRDTPPLTRFLAEQLATAHWFDQRHTREALDWTPRVTLDAGFAALTKHYREAQRLIAAQ